MKFYDFCANPYFYATPVDAQDSADAPKVAAFQAESDGLQAHL
jgi:hypothetical protein